MSKRSKTILIIQVRIPVPVGKTQEQTQEMLKLFLNAGSYPDDLKTFISPQTIVKITGRETTYL